MRLWVNGEVREARDGENLLALLEGMSINPLKVAVERNLAIVPKSGYSNTVLEPDDKLEIVQFVGGG
ncbi:MAG: sulfur carrier protein ThiS [Caulobacterales bacterium]